MTSHDRIKAPEAPGSGSAPQSTLSRLDARSREIFRRIVEAYLETGEPLGSRTLSRQIAAPLSPASIRNVMSDLEALGLVYAPHVSAGRLPTESGMRLFVDALLEVGDLSAAERARIEAEVRAASPGRTVESVLSEAGTMLSGLSRGAGIVLSQKSDLRLKHVEFVRLEPTKALVVLVGEDGTVENRVIDIDAGLPGSALIEASNYLNAQVRGRTLAEARAEIERIRQATQAALDTLTQSIVDAGLASWAGNGRETATLIVRGSANLLDDLKTMEDLERVRLLFEDLEMKTEFVQLLGLAEMGEGVKIFIGSENKLFSLSGSSLVVSPYRDAQQKVVGVLGVIGPTRLNYARIVPVVDYTARVVSRLLGSTAG